MAFFSLRPTGGRRSPSLLKPSMNHHKPHARETRMSCTKILPRLLSSKLIFSYKLEFYVRCRTLPLLHFIPCFAFRSTQKGDDWNSQHRPATKRGANDGKITPKPTEKKTTTTRSVTIRKTTTGRNANLWRNLGQYFTSKRPPSAL